MWQGKRIGAVLLMGGEGRRFGSVMPKQFHLLDGKPLYRYALEALVEVGIFDEIVLVCHRDWMGSVEGARVVEGGQTRQESSYLGLKEFLRKPDIVLIHDGVRPFVTAEILKKNVERAIAVGAVDTCIPSTDTLVYAPSLGKERRLISEIPKREDYWRGQTPQTFRTEWILEAHERAIREGNENATDDCRLILRAGREVEIVLGDERNLKITSEFDLWLAEKWINERKALGNPRSCPLQF